MKKREWAFLTFLAIIEIFIFTYRIVCIDERCSDVMLGELLGEARGKITGMKVLPDGKVELTCQGNGKVLGMEATEIITYEQWVRPGGVFCGEGQMLFMTKDGEMAFWKGFGLGKPTGPGFAARYAVCGSFQTASPKLARLLDVAIVTEYEMDENGNYHYKSWEWK